MNNVGGFGATTAQTRARRRLGPYAVTEAAVLRMTEVPSNDLRELALRVNAVLPSVMDAEAG